MTKAIEFNYDLNYDYSTDKARITKIKYDYFDFNKDIISAIASKNVVNKELSANEIYTLIQAIQPTAMIADGLFDPILFFEIDQLGKRIDPPYAAWQNILEPDKTFNVCLVKEFVKLFKNNDISYHSSWNEVLSWENSIKYD